MEIKRIADNYNPFKVWVIKRYECGHYYVNQEIRGKVLYKSFSRTTLKYLDDVLGLF